MKLFFYILCFLSFGLTLSGQNFSGNTIDSLKYLINNRTKNDAAKVDLYNELSREYFIDGYPEKSVLYARQAQQLGNSIHYEIGEAIAVRNTGNYFFLSSDYDQAIEYYQISLSISESANYTDGIASALGNIGAMYNELSNYNQAIVYYQKSIEIYHKLGNKADEGATYNNIGLAYTNLSDYPKAIEAFQKAIKIGENLNDQALLVKSLNNMGFAYSDLHDYQKMLDYSKRALKIYRQSGNKKGEAYALNNLGNAIAKMSDYNDLEALDYYEKSFSLAEKINDRMAKSMALSSMGEFYFNASDYEKALHYSQKSLEISREINDKNGMAYEFTNMANSYLALTDSLFLKTNKINRYEIAQKYADSALQINQEIGNISGQKNTWKTLMEIYLKQENYKQVYLAYSNYVKLNDSIQGEKVRNDILRKEMEFEFDKKTSLVREEQEKKNITQRNIRISLLTGLVGLILFSGLLTRQRNKLKIEKKRSENLLLNILPVEVAEELKQTGRAKARKYDNISILFTDFVNFTQTSEQLTPEDLIEELNECFTAFDHIMEKNGLEKIKTIGDAYMAVCGLPNSLNDHAQRTVQAALEIATYIQNRGIKEKVFYIRIGINSGSAVAGIVGVKKFAYDIWGDAVNIAARMEQYGEKGKVNISEATFQLIKEDFLCEYRGEIAAKNKGKLKMYFVQKPVG